MNQSMPEILFIDEALLIINKPAGLLSIPDGYNPSLPHVGSVLSEQYSRLWIVHRLDRETSGILLLARTPEAHKNLCLQFEKRKIQKKYQALIWGTPSWSQQTIDLPLLINGDRKHRTVISPQNGKPATTDITICQRYSAGIKLVEAAPHTGYTHQIRAHLCAIGFPLLADPLYTRPQPDYPLPSNTVYPTPFISRLALHAAHIQFHHPLNETLLEITAPPPDDFQSAITHLKS